jgi:catalase (peroxidase I)
MRVAAPKSISSVAASQRAANKVDLDIFQALHRVEWMETRDPERAGQWKEAANHLRAARDVVQQMMDPVDLSSAKGGAQVRSERQIGKYEKIIRRNG